MSGLQIALDLGPLVIFFLSHEADEVDLTVTLLLLDDKNVSTIHRSDQDALGTEQIVVSFLVFGLLDLLDDEWEILSLHLSDH